MSLKDQLQADVMTAMKAKDALKRDTLRLVLSRMNQAELSGPQRADFSDQQVQTFLQKEVKTRKDSEQVYSELGQELRAEREAQEAAILSAYLPEALTEDAIRALVLEAVESGANNIGAIMKAVSSVDGMDRGAASKIAREVLATI